MTGACRGLGAEITAVLARASAAVSCAHMGGAEETCGKWSKVAGIRLGVSSSMSEIPLQSANDSTGSAKRTPAWTWL